MAEGVKQCAQNRKAWHDYFIEDKLEAGIELFGTEVKSIRGGKCNLKDSYVEIKDGEAYKRVCMDGPVFTAEEVCFFD